MGSEMCIRDRGVELGPLAEVNHPQDPTDQKCQGSDAINNVGDHHRRGLLAIRIRFDQLPLQHQSAKAEHEAEVVNVGNASVFGDVGRESDGQGHGRGGGRCGDLSHPIELTMKDSLQ